MDGVSISISNYKCAQCNKYKEVAYKWGECLHYPCMADPNDPACNEFELKEEQV